MILFLVFVSTYFLFLYLNKVKPVPNQTIITGSFVAELKIHDSLPKSLVIQDDGTMMFEEGDEMNESKISPPEIESLEQLILASNFFSLRENYEGSGCCDFVAHTITVTIGDKKLSVYCYNDCPKEFNAVEEGIKNLWPDEIKYYGFS